MTTNEARTLITSVLITLGYNQPNLVNLLLGTMAQESDMGMYETQENGGPARGIFMCENATFQDINTNFLAYQSTLNTAIQSYAPANAVGTADDLVGNHEYACAYASCSYVRHHVPASTIDPGDIATMYSLYKLYFNGPGAATQTEFTNNWTAFGIS